MMNKTRRFLAAFVLANSLLLALASVSLAADPFPQPYSNTAVECPVPDPRALLAGDSWAQYMWDDDSHNDIFDKFGHADKRMISRSLSDHPGSGYTGPEYAVSGSEAREWVNTNDYPFLQNMLDDLNANSTIDTVVLSIGGNDVLEGKPDGWYKDMDQDPNGIHTEAEFFERLRTDTLVIIDSILAVRPEMKVIISGYDYPNFDMGFIECLIYACAKLEDLSLDPDNDLITDEEINAMMIGVEDQRIGWANDNTRVYYDHSLGLMHHYYGDGVTGPGLLPHPGQDPPDYLPFPGGNPQLPSLRANFRIWGDPIHLDYDGYQYKITTETMSYFFPLFRGEPAATFSSVGGAQDGWTDGSAVGTGSIYLGDNGSVPYTGILSFDTSGIPERAIVTQASLYLIRQSGLGTNPFESGNLGALSLDIARGSFGSPVVEAGDATAPADADDAGCIYGTVKDDYYALRADVTSQGVNAINTDGLTQFRLAFNASDGASIDRVEFHNGDSTLPSLSQRLYTKQIERKEALPNGDTFTFIDSVTAINHIGLAEYNNSPSPFLDVGYCLAPDKTTVSISRPADALLLSWEPAADAEDYEVWHSADDPYFQPGADCEAASNCTVTTATSFSPPQGQQNAGLNSTFLVRARNQCAGGATSTASNATAEFTFALTTG